MGAMCCTEGNQNTYNEDNTQMKKEMPFKINFRQGTFKDRAYGAILGSLLGSACGATSDNFVEVCTSEEALTRMSMPGGGFHGIAPG